MNKSNVLVFGKITIEKLKGTKYQIRIGKSKEKLDFKDLWKALFLFSSVEQQEMLMPARSEERMVFSRKHTIQATKDIKAGEMINVWCEVNVKDTVVNSIAEENGAKVIFKTPENTNIKLSTVEFKN